MGGQGLTVYDTSCQKYLQAHRTTIRENRRFFIWTLDAAAFEQFYDFYAISIFRQTGTPLEEIRRCLKRQDAAQTLAILREQRSRLEAERQKLEHMDFVLSSALPNWKSVCIPY